MDYEEIKDQYFPHTKNSRLRSFLDAVTFNNQKNTASKVEVDPRTIARYKRKMGQMSKEERNYFIQKLAEKNLED